MTKAEKFILLLQTEVIRRDITHNRIMCTRVLVSALDIQNSDIPDDYDLDIAVEEFAEYQYQEGRFHGPDRPAETIPPTEWIQKYFDRKKGMKRLVEEVNI